MERKIFKIPLKLAIDHLSVLFQFDDWTFSVFFVDFDNITEIKKQNIKIRVSKYEIKVKLKRLDKKCSAMRGGFANLTLKTIMNTFNPL